MTPVMLSVEAAVLRGACAGHLSARLIGIVEIDL